jgi:hypothetical protein
MGTLIDSKPSDPMYSEGPQSYSPHWARSVARPAAPKLPEPEPPKDDAASTMKPPKPEARHNAPPRR